MTGVPRWFAFGRVGILSVTASLATVSRKRAARGRADGAPRVRKNPSPRVLVEILVKESKETTQFEVDMCPLLVRGAVEHVF